MQAIEQAIITRYDIARLEEIVNDCLKIYRNDSLGEMVDYVNHFCSFLSQEQKDSFCNAVIVSAANGVISVNYSEVTE